MKTVYLVINQKTNFVFGLFSDCTKASEYAYSFGKELGIEYAVVKRTIDAI